ncbi:hypothetical protein L6452_32427 [Arctium lappa]|uniref:Uncharacterized protein n=1 Tax=Arctium lappa TaxID=4217 RepID=A0ACB8Z4Y6_ARCLA|nr:hypothetical protein L6452_32427 [Arctium lappa]
MQPDSTPAILPPSIDSAHNTANHAVGSSIQSAHATPHADDSTDHHAVGPSVHAAHNITGPSAHANGSTDPHAVGLSVQSAHAAPYTTNPLPPHYHQRTILLSTYSLP